MATDMTGPQVPPSGRLSDGDMPVRIYGCNRLGRQANPPGIRNPFGDWLRRR